MSSYSFSYLIKTSSTKIEASIICDRDKELGCNLNFKRLIKPLRTAYVPDSTPNFGFEALDYFSFHEIQFGEHTQLLPITQSFTPHLNKKSRKLKKLNTAIPFPDITLDEQSLSPYSISGDSTFINFYGKIHDIKTGELLGWFDENEFGVIQSCSFSWNKDEKGIEIIDKYGNVCFSVDLQEIDKIVHIADLLKAMDKSEKSNIIEVDSSHRKLYSKESVLEVYKYDTRLIFKGYFMHNENYFIINDSLYITKDIRIAEEKIKMISPIFDHFGKNSIGSRIVY